MSSWKNQYFCFEEKVIEKLKETPYVHQFIHDQHSARITLFLLVIGTIAFFNELWITIEMSLIQKETYDELNLGRIDEGLKLHRMIVSDEYHGREYKDEKSGIVIEEFEDRDKFFAKPVFVSELTVDCNIEKNGKTILERPLSFHIEFTPEEWELEKRPEFGCPLSLLRLKLYHLFRDSRFYTELVDPSTDSFTVSKGIIIYNKMGELLPASVDSVQLCFLKIETGCHINATFVIN